MNPPNKQCLIFQNIIARYSVYVANFLEDLPALVLLILMIDCINLVVKPKECDEVDQISPTSLIEVGKVDWAKLIQDVLTEVGPI